MKVTIGKAIVQLARLFFLVVALLCCVLPASAKDTDIYKVSSKSNCYILFDSSGSMAWPIYESSIDYGAMFNRLFTLSDFPDGDYSDYIYDFTNGAAYYQNHKPVNEIYLVKGNVKVNIATSGGQTIAFTGDTGDTSRTWDRTNLVATNTKIDSDGNLVPTGAGTQRLTVDSNGHIRLDNFLLPQGQDALQHDNITLGDGSIIDQGFIGQLNAPGIYFSGYEGVAASSLDPVEDNDTSTYFFVTGNWINFKAMLGLKYNGVNGGDYAWKYETFLINPVSWSEVLMTVQYPDPHNVNYTNNLNEGTTQKIIFHSGAKKIQVHFSSFDVKGDGSVSTFSKDYLKMYNSLGGLVDQFDNDLKPTSVDSGWSTAISGDTVILKLKSDGSTTGTGYVIDKIRVLYNDAAGGSYTTQSRNDAAKEGMAYAVNALGDKINWGLFSFDTTGSADGATALRLIDTTESDAAQRADMIAKINTVGADGGTPLMESLQDVWKQGYYNLKGSATAFLNQKCSRNYVIVMTDGAPSVDLENQRISVGGTTIKFLDWDGDGWTQDPTQGTAPNYYDDVAHWMYMKSWRTFNTNVSDPLASYENVISHHIAFGAKHPLLNDAAYGKSTDSSPRGSGGSFISVSNKAQMVSAFYSLGLAMSGSVSFTAPVVSVDANNKIQNGDDLYMGLFLPQDNNYWVGNLKKFKLGSGDNRFDIYGNDAANTLVQVTNANGVFINTVDDLWDFHDDSNGAADIKVDGAGEVLLKDVKSFLVAGATTASAYWNRPVFTYKGGTMVKFDRDNITATDLGVADNATRDKLINFIHGYTYEANAATGAPLAVRDWILGPIVHSRPVVVEYYDTSNPPALPLVKRLVAVGSNDGMLHVFNDADGKEVFAFIPQDILPKLKTVQSTRGLVDTVDGLLTLYRRDKNPKYLIFGEREGGGDFWNLDVQDLNPVNWDVKWNYTNSEISKSWSEVKVASLPVSIDTNGVRTYKDVAIFTGGYDPGEDNFPEPFTDANNNGKMDSGEWVVATQDKNGNGVYDKYNSVMDTKGRGIFVVDVDIPATVYNAMVINPLNPSGPLVSQQVLPFSVTYGAATVASGVTQTMSDMKFSFPASPAVVTGTDQYTYYDIATSSSKTVTKGNVLLSLYAVDIYANLIKARYAFDLENANPNGVIPYWEASSVGWTVKPIFSGNPGSSSGSGRMGAGYDITDQGRKAFYPPTISWGGTKGKFEAGNYYFQNVTFSTSDKMASLFFGTGDREHPNYTMIRNRFYAIYDDSSVTAIQNTTPLASTPTYVNAQVTSAPYDENDLLNVTCDELGVNSTINSCYMGASLPSWATCTASTADVDMKSFLNTLLTDDAVYGTSSALEGGPAHENDAKGWYITLEDQGSSTKCSHVTYYTSPSSITTNSHDNHVGEQVLSQAILYYGNLYFTSYQPTTTDPCKPEGNGFTYALSYLDGSAAFDLNPLSTGGYTKKTDITDRYNKYTGIVGIPSGFSIITRDGHAAAFASVGSMLKGPGKDGDPEIPTPGLGLQLYYWRDSNSQQP
ncbi:MAG: hypothetical protein JZU65_06275 [Chlorobium sp.]|nr:hypothetical protein [Chlorobium sp.]